MIDLPSEIPHQQTVPARGSTSGAITIPCSQHGSAGFTHLTVSQRDGAIVLNSHGAYSCVITLDETAATALFDLLGEWLG
ncbi:MAG: hypothetical protein JO115_01885 [Pseudonocardiales bacterium]|nr:hypothetical protein [Pseudonocardiales bacterium]